MMIFMLAAVMTVAMLLATAFALHQEAEKLRLRHKQNATRGFGSR